MARRSLTKHLRTLSGLAVTLAIVALAAAARAPSALADGDPASDVLVSAPLFLPPDAGLTLHQQSELGALLEAAAKSGYPLRVAVIASPADLGSVTPLWRQPQSYAGFLGEELSLLYKGTLLVVMPDGFGLYGPGAAASAQRAALSATRREAWCDDDRGRRAAVGGRRTPPVGRPGRDPFGPELDRLHSLDRTRDRRGFDRGRVDRERARTSARIPARADGIDEGAARRRAGLGYRPPVTPCAALRG